MNNVDSTRDTGDHILLLPASQPPSQVSTPSIATVPSFLNNSDSNLGTRTSTPSISLSHRGPAIPPDPQTEGGSSTSVKIPTSSTNPGGDSGHPSSVTAADSSVPSNHRARASEHVHGHSLTFFKKYIISPAQSFKAYLASPNRESTYRNSKIPPWLLPHYRGHKPVLRSTILRPLCRLLLVVVILAVLIAATIMYSFREGQPQLSDYSAIKEFDWPPIQPRSYLSPMNSSFGNDYDVLLDGHSHTTYSDGRMTPETLIKWHIGKSLAAIGAVYCKTSHILKYYYLWSKTHSLSQRLQCSDRHRSQHDQRRTGSTNDRQGKIRGPNYCDPRNGADVSICKSDITLCPPETH